nr:type VI secretion system-associated FHA domain protein TagH [Cellvibrionaceae bacterium]
AEKSPGDNSFLSGLRQVNGEPSAAQLDPLAGLGGGDRSEIAWDSDEDWWRSESEADNVPLDRHAIDVKPKMPSPPIQPKRKPPLPEPVAPPQKPAEDNPFEASAALVQGELSDTSEILDSVGASSDAARSAFPQIPATPPAEAPQMPHVPLEPKPADPVPPQVAQTPPQQPLFPGISNTGPARAGVAAEPGSAHHTADLQNVKALAQSLGLGNMEEQQLQQLLPEAGAIIEECISRLMDLMRARASVKNELRVAQTMIQLQDNNPLKFSVTPQDAILAMFGNSNSAYMSPTEAVKDSFNDLSDHQMAVLSGMRAAYEYMLRQFSPKMLERRLNIKSSHVILSKNAKKWEAYEKLFESLQKDPENTYHRFFGDEFSSAYEEQLGKLKNSRQLKRRDS